MRLIIFGSTGLVIILSLLLLEDMDIALPVVVLLVWAIVLVAGLLVRLRAVRRRGPRPLRPRRPRIARRIAWRRTPKPLALPRR